MANGNLYPHTDASRVIAIVLMFVGIGFIAVLSATILAMLRRLDSEVAEIKATLARRGS